MASPSYSDIYRYARTLQHISQKAREEFLKAVELVDFSDWTIAAEQLRDIIEAVMKKYGAAAAELGAQWYEYCREMAFDSRYTAIVGETSRYSAKSDTNAAIDKLFEGEITVEKLIDDLAGIVVNQVHRESRDTILENLQAERLDAIRRGDRKAADMMGYSRVPTASACAFCLMLASQGFVYTSEQTATKKKNGEKYHEDCRCVAVPFHKAGTIPGYGGKLTEYESMYRDADNTRRSGKLPNGDDMPDELKERIKEARKEHQKAYEAGETSARWDPSLNENLIIMRYLNPGLH